MKTLHINTEKTWRGGERQTLFTLKGLHDHGIEAHLVCQPTAPLFERARDAGISVWPVAMRGEADPAASLAIRRLVQQNGFDLIHSHTSHAHTLAYWATVRLPLVRLVTRRVEFSIFRNSFFRLNWIKYKYMADAYIAISDHIKAVMTSDGVSGHLIHVVPSGVVINPDITGADRLRAEFVVEASTPVLLSVAHLSPEKGHHLLLQAMAKLTDKHAAIRLFIVGDGPCRADLEATAKKLGIERLVVFTGFRDDVSAFYDMATGFISSSTAEGLGSAALDALAAGVPVVAAAAGGIPEFIKNGRTGILVPRGSSSALATGISDLLRHPRRVSEMADRGRELVRSRFSVDTMVNGTLDVYRQLVRQ